MNRRNLLSLLLGLPFIPKAMLAPAAQAAAIPASVPKVVKWHPGHYSLFAHHPQPTTAELLRLFDSGAITETDWKGGSGTHHWGKLG